MEMAGWAQLVGAGAVGLTAGLTIALVLLKQPAQQSKGMSFPLYLWLYIWLYIAYEVISLDLPVCRQSVFLHIFFCFFNK